MVNRHAESAIDFGRGSAAACAWSRWNRARLTEYLPAPRAGTRLHAASQSRHTIEGVNVAGIGCAERIMQPAGDDAPKRSEQPKLCRHAIPQDMSVRVAPSACWARLLVAHLVGMFD